MLTTQGWAPRRTLSTPSPIPSAEAEYARALASEVAQCRFVQAEFRSHGNLFIGCSGGAIVVAGIDGRVLRSTHVPMDGINMIEPAGPSAVAINGWNDGAALQNGLSILRTSTLKAIVAHAMPDSTYLGTIGDYAFIDDWCCNGRADEYLPATIYSISLTDGTESKHVDLAPDSQAHPADSQPLGQGEWNYMIGTSLYVVVGPITYRYDVRDLRSGPIRLSTPPQLRLNG